MKFQEGPLFGALIIGAGIGFLYHQQTGDLGLAALIGVGIAVADYVIVVWLKTRFKGK